MATQIQFRRGTTAEHSTFTGAVGEVTVDTDKDTAVVHDGSTAGGIPLAKESDIPTITSFAETILDDADAATARATLGVAIGTDVQAFDADTTKNDVANTFTAAQTFQDVVTFDNGTVSEVTAITSTAGAATLDLSVGDNFTHTLTENVTYTFSNPATSGKASAFTLKVVQDASASGYTITWPTSVDWAAATAPTLTVTASAVDYFVFITTDGGTTYYGFVAGQALA